MDYELKQVGDDWQATETDVNGDQPGFAPGDVLSATFSGPGAEQAATEYHEWRKNKAMKQAPAGSGFGNS